MNEFPNQPLKKISNDFDKISLLFETALESEATRLSPTDQLASVGSSKCPINKMIGSQGHLRPSAYLREQHYIIQRLFQS